MLHFYYNFHSQHLLFPLKNGNSYDSKNKSSQFSQLKWLPIHPKETEQFDQIRHRKLGDHDQESRLRRAQRLDALDHCPCDPGTDHATQQHIFRLYFSDGRYTLPSCEKPCRKTDHKCRNLNPAVADPHSCSLCYLGIEYSLNAHKRA